MDDLKKAYNDIIKKLNMQEKYVNGIKSSLVYRREITKTDKKKYDDTDKFNVFLETIKQVDFIIKQIEEKIGRDMTSEEILEGFK
jgi:hypothetical protein